MVQERGEAANAHEVPVVTDITPKHTIEQFLLSAMLELIDDQGVSIEGAFRVGGNVFKWRFSITDVILATNPPDKEKPQ